MKLSLTSLLLAGGAIASSMATAIAPNFTSTYLNPVIPGWHSDPSCIYHSSSSTFFCATSTFIAFPGIPIYASKDLINWKLISHVWNRESQLPGVSGNTTGQMDGMYAPTLRFHDGEFWVVCEYLGGGNAGPTEPISGIKGVLFRTTDPFDEASWSDPLWFGASAIDPDLFWDDDGKLYIATQGIVLQEINLETGGLTWPPISLWNGTGGVWPEGPHLYKKDGWYYLLIAEGGTALDHAVTIARSRNIKGPYEPYTEGNPILTNRGTDEYFQTVGHADLFQDAKGNWWGMCLATRGGPAYDSYPMGRETVLFPVTWEKDEWPVLHGPVRGRMSGWELPEPSRNVAGEGPWVGDPDVYDFKAGQPLPRNLIYWRVPRPGAITATDKGLQMIPSRNNVTGRVFEGSANQVELSGQRGMSFIGRRQTDSLFVFSVDLVGFNPKNVGSEAGVTVFLTQLNHIDLGVVLLESERGGKPTLAFRFRVEAPPGSPVPEEQILPLPPTWAGKTIRLEVSVQNVTHYQLAASLANAPRSKPVIGRAWAGLVSGATGQFTGALLGVYATCNGAGQGEDCPGGGDKAYWQRWRYSGRGQEIAEGEVV